MVICTQKNKHLHVQKKTPLKCTEKKKRKKFITGEMLFNPPLVHALQL